MRLKHHRPQSGNLAQPFAQVLLSHGLLGEKLLSALSPSNSTGKSAITQRKYTTRLVAPP